MSLPQWQEIPIISGRTAGRLLDADPGAVTVSLDLGRGRCTVRVEPDTLILPDDRAIGRRELADAFSEPEDCIEIRGGTCRKVYLYDPVLRKYYKLYQPFEDSPPTIIINGATMHSIVEVAPWEGVRQMVEQVPERAGRCFDTCCGLGYSAQLLLGRGFEGVTTCEVDRNVLEVAAINPWSEELFRSPRVEIVLADLREYARDCPEGEFDCVFHDPPTIQMAGELYGEALYREFRRILASGGSLYHYVGRPGRRRGQDYARGVMQRLQSAGFVRVRRVAEGVLAFNRRDPLIPRTRARGRPG